MQSRCGRRLLSELTSLRRQGKDDEIELNCASDGDLMLWHARIRGPPDTGYEGAWFDLEIQVPEDYPQRGPDSGEVCLDILKEEWSPAFTLGSVCRAIISLLADPEPDSPLNCDAALLLRCGDMMGYESMVRMYVHMFPSSPPDGHLSS